MTVNSEGGVMACQFAQDWTVGNIRDISFAEATRRLFEIDGQESKGQCSPEACDYSRICRGCRVKAWQRTGDTMEEDITCILHPQERDIPQDIKEKFSINVAPCQGNCGA